MEMPSSVVNYEFLYSHPAPSITLFDQRETEKESTYQQKPMVAIFSAPCSFRYATVCSMRASRQPVCDWIAEG
jgi:hypothetical protein